MSILVLVPAAHPPLSGAWTEAETRREAAERLEHALERLDDMGAQATGQVGDPRVVDAVMDALRVADYDEIVVSILPPGVSRWLRLDLLSRLRRITDVRVTHVVGEPERVG